MHIITAKVTSKFQATVPKEIREKLHLSVHDQLVYEIRNDNEIVLRKATPFDLDYLRAIQYTLNEWNSPEDEEAYKNL